MKKNMGCSQKERLADIVDQGGVIPRDFTVHAQFCDHCHFWLSYTLAAMKASNTTNHIYHESCPVAEIFKAMLLLSATSIRKGVPRSQAKQFLTAHRSLLPIFLPARIHLEACDTCGNYYDDLYDAMLRYQAEYEKAIDAGTPIGVPSDISRVEQFIPREIPGFDIEDDSKKSN